MLFRKALGRVDGKAAVLKEEEEGEAWFLLGALTVTPVGGTVPEVSGSGGSKLADSDHAD